MTATRQADRTLRIVWVNDEQVDITLDSVEIISVNHDSHGWDGMQAVMTATARMAEALSIPVVIEREPNLEMDL